jgi:hypothetical protein
MNFSVKKTICPCERQGMESLRVSTKKNVCMLIIQKARNYRIITLTDLTLFEHQ